MFVNRAFGQNIYHKQIILCIFSNKKVGVFQNYY